MFTPSEYRICCTIAICLLIAVLSAISLLNLTVYVTLPARKTVEIGFQDDPVVCETMEASDNLKDTCTWGSCSEWCLSKSSGCMQINVTVRYMGNDLKVSGCTQRRNHSCYPAEVKELKGLHCGDKECRKYPMTGTWYCVEGICKDLSKMYICPTTLSPDVIHCNVVEYCKELTGVYECQNSHCRQIMSPANPTRPSNLTDCTRICGAIDTAGFNLHVIVGYVLEQLQCDRIIKINGSTLQGWPGQGILSCRTLIQEVGDSELYFKDCFNGIIASLSDRPHSMRELMAMTRNPSNQPLDPTQEVVPLLDHPRNPLLLFNKTKLQVNLEGCVNTLRGECQAIFQDNGKDGKDGQYAPATYPCYYAPTYSEMVILKYNRSETVFHAILFFFLPLGLLLVSCSTLCFCAKAVAVEGERMYFRPCGEPTHHTNRGHGHNKNHRPSKAMAV